MQYEDDEEDCESVRATEETGAQETDCRRRMRRELGDHDRMALSGVQELSDEQWQGVLQCARVQTS